MPLLLLIVLQTHPALVIAGHNTETRPSVDDVVSLFGEQDIEE